MSKRKIAIAAQIKGFNIWGDENCYNFLLCCGSDLMTTLEPTELDPFVGFTGGVEEAL